MVEKVKDLRLYAWILLYSIVTGTIDEIIQFFLPNRVYEFRDMMVNWLSSIISTGLLLLVTVDKRLLLKGERDLQGINIVSSSGDTSHIHAK
jgi:VanZ family protein